MKLKILAVRNLDCKQSVSITKELKKMRSFTFLFLAMLASTVCYSQNDSFYLLDGNSDGGESLRIQKGSFGPEIYFRTYDNDDDKHFRYRIESSGSYLNFRYSLRRRSYNASQTPMRLYSFDGSFSILQVNGEVECEEIEVKEMNLPDYVFEDNYDLMPLSLVKRYIDENKHLPEVPSASEVRENGMALGDMTSILLKKIEELTLHTIEQEERIKQLEVALSKVSK